MLASRGRSRITQASGSGERVRRAEVTSGGERLDRNGVWSVSGKERIWRELVWAAATWSRINEDRVEG